MASSSAPIQSKEDFKDNPRGQQDYWLAEMTAARTRLRKWHGQATKIVDRYLGNTNRDDIQGKSFRLNMFNTNVKTLMSMMYGNLPRVDVSRADQTGNDDVGRVASNMMEKILRSSVMREGNLYDAVFPAVLQDRLLSGLGVARVRYEMVEERTVTAVKTDDITAISPETQLVFEDSPIDYYYWGDVMWGWGRTFEEIPWIAFRSYLTKDEVTERFGDYAANNVEYKQQQVVDLKDAPDANPDTNSAWQKAEIWEIWDKSERKVVWFSFSCSKLLDSKPDTLKLRNFYPCPPFLLANPTTSLYMPTPDFSLSQDLYNGIDRLQTRISILTDAVKAVGVYDKSSEGVQRMFREGVENDLIPVDNWAMFGEKGGLKGQVDWLPIDAVSNALDKLRALRDETIGLLQQVSGMSDIMRGSLGNQYEGVGQSEMKAKYGSTRVQALQEQFAHFVSDLMAIKAEIICKHYSEQTILQQSNAQFSFDLDTVPQAVQLLKSDDFGLRVEIKPETLAQLDYAQLREERTMYLNGLATFLQSASPLVAQDPRSTPFLLQMLKWAMAGFKGSSEIEGVLDDAIEAMSQPEAQKEAEKPNPEQIRAETQVKLEEMRMQAKMQEIQMKAQADMQMRQLDKQADIETEQARMQMEMMRINAEMEAEMAKLQAKMEADVRTEFLTSKFDAEQARETAQAQVQAQIIKSRTEMAKLAQQNRVDVAMKAFEKQADMELKREEMANNRLNEAKNDEAE